MIARSARQRRTKEKAPLMISGACGMTHCCKPDQFRGGVYWNGVATKPASTWIASMYIDGA